MKITGLTFILMLASYFAIGQAKLEGQLGGSNFVGFSLNSAFDIPLSKNKDHLLIPSFGLGVLAPQWGESTCIIHTGLNYNYKKIGIGAELSGFTRNPFVVNEEAGDFVNMLIYPNANYTFTTKSNWYFRISAGAYFAYSKSYLYNGTDPRMEFEGDVIPGVGFNVGYKF